MLTRSMHTWKDFLHANTVSHIIETMLNRRFDHDLFGLRPAHPLFHEHPTINDQLASKILCGVIHVKGDVKELSAVGAKFEGEEAVHEVDSILLATGYHVEYSFLSKDLREQIVNTENNSVNLYKYVFPVLEHEDSEDGDIRSTLAFIGVPNALGPLFPVAELQARWVVQVLKGNTKLPGVSEMRDALAVQEVKRKK